MADEKLSQLREDIQKLVTEYAELFKNTQSIESGVNYIPASGKKLGVSEFNYMVDAVLDGWLTTGRFNKEFEKKLADIIDTKYCLTTNSGSSANLLAFTALTSPRLGERAIKPGDEVITVAAGFPTTINPILQNNCIPVFIDVEKDTYNIDTSDLESAITSKTKAIMLAHTLGNPFNIDEILRIAKKYDLWLIEDCCDALGAYYTPNLDHDRGLNNKIASGLPRHVGTFGDLSTLSFYPAHHITMGEGGAVFGSNNKLMTIVESYRDWGRDCYCAPGQDNSCNQRFCWKLGDLPKGYDHKYIYSHLGYNLKITDMQAACGLGQLEQLDKFIESRKSNFYLIKEHLEGLSEHILLPRAYNNSTPSWFGFPITIKNQNIKRVEFLQYLESKRIGTRLLFAGNVTKQPYMQGKKFKIHGQLENTDNIMHNTFWIGVQPSLSYENIKYMTDTIKTYINKIS